MASIHHTAIDEELAGKIRAGGAGVWGNIPMPPQSISTEDANKVAEWLASGAK